MMAGLAAVASEDPTPQKTKRKLGAYTGEAYRGPGHSQYLHACKRAKHSGKYAEQIALQQKPLEHAWNEERLRRGDRVGVATPREDGAQANAQANAYHPTGVLRECWKMIGKNRTLRGGVDGHHRALAITATVGSCLNLEQEDFMRKQVGEMLDSGAHVAPLPS